MKQLQTKRYGWKPDLPDHRDFLMVPRVKKLPHIVDLRQGNRFLPVQDQLDLGSCTAHAIAAAMGFYNGCQVSRLFIYYQERVIERTVKEDAGAQIRDGVKACAKIGAPAERYWAYNTRKFATAPTKTACMHAGNNVILNYARVLTLGGLRAALASGTPVVFGFSVYDSFESEKVALTGKVPMPRNDEQLIGGHAVCAVGYDDRREVVICRNSWGPDWGDKGHFYLPYEFVENRNLSDDYWAIKAST